MGFYGDNFASKRDFGGGYIAFVFASIGFVVPIIGFAFVNVGFVAPNGFVVPKVG